MTERLCAVVVTYNRPELLRECLRAVEGQTRPADTVLVVDNASTDETPELLAGEFPGVEVLRLGRNDGSSGGFHDGLAWAQARGFDWIWVMDDDTIPAPDALELLLTARGRMDGLPAPVMLASKVLWSDGRLHPMNYPGFNFWDLNIFIAALERGFILLRHNTFPSLLIKREALERHGLPRRHWFIWSDDIEFTQRILRDEAGYLVPESVVEHRTKTAHEPWQGGERFYFALRNGVWILRGRSLRQREKLGWGFLLGNQLQRFLSHERYRPTALRVVARGVRDGLLRRPT